MPADDPKKPIEEMLEASAKARRAAFGKEPVMPNPMRARLHDEITRTARERTDTAPERSWLQMFWPRIAVAAALATILVVGPMMWWRGSQSRSASLAQADSRATSVNESTDAVARADDTFVKGPAVAAAPNVSLADNERAKLVPEQTPVPAADSLDQSKIAAQAETSTPAVASATGQVTKGFIDKQDKASETENTGSLQPAAPATSRLASKDEPGAALGAPAGARAQQFASQAAGQAFRNSAQSNRSPNLLNNFHVQQQGTEIRIVDSDGSIYAGRFESTAEGRSRALAKKNYESRAESDDKAALQSQSRFRASGYNVTLKKSVVVDADYSTTGVPEQSQRQKAQPTETQNARIIGTARVNGEPPVQIDATAVRQ